MSVIPIKYASVFKKRNTFTIYNAIIKGLDKTKCIVFSNEGDPAAVLTTVKHKGKTEQKRNTAKQHEHILLLDRSKTILSKLFR
jgi:hypothetical protein